MIWAVAVDVAPQHLFSGPYRATWKLYSGDVLIATGTANGAQPPPGRGHMARMAQLTFGSSHVWRKNARGGRRS